MKIKIDLMPACSGTEMLAMFLCDHIEEKDKGKFLSDAGIDDLIEIDLKDQKIGEHEEELIKVNIRKYANTVIGAFMLMIQFSAVGPLKNVEKFRQNIENIPVSGNFDIRIMSAAMQNLNDPIKELLARRAEENIKIYSSIFISAIIEKKTDFLERFIFVTSEVEKITLCSLMVSL